MRGGRRGWDAGIPNPQDVLQLKSSQAAGKHGAGRQDDFVLIRTPVQATCCQKKIIGFPSDVFFCVPLPRSLSALSPGPPVARWCWGRSKQHTPPPFSPERQLVQLPPVNLQLVPRVPRTHYV